MSRLVGREASIDKGPLSIGPNGAKDDYGQRWSKSNLGQSKCDCVVVCSAEERGVMLSVSPNLELGFPPAKGFDRSTRQVGGR